MSIRKTIFVAKKQAKDFDEIFTECGERKNPGEPYWGFVRTFFYL